MYQTATRIHLKIFSTTYVAFLILFCSAFPNLVHGQNLVGDWELRVDAEGTSFERRIALTPSQQFSGGIPKAFIAVRRLTSDSPVELFVKASLDEEQKECDYSDWELAIDATDIPVSGLHVSSSAAVLKLRYGYPEGELWKAFRKGKKLAIRVKQKCGGFFGNVKIKVLTFSLRGSTAAYNYVLGGDR